MVKMTRLQAAVLGCTLALALMSCGDDPDVAPASESDVPTAEASPSESAPDSSEADTELPTGEVLEEFFDALASEDTGMLEDALGLAVEGSLAYAYADYRLTALNAAVDGGMPLAGADQATEVEGGYESCQDPTDDSTCATWTDFEGEDGKIAEFKVNGEALGPRLTAGDGRAVRAGGLGSVTFRYAYQSPVSNTLYVTAQVAAADAPATAATYQATYRSPEGRQSTASETFGPTDLAPNSNASVVMIFPGAEPGGTVSLSFFSDDFMTEEIVEFRTR